MTSHFWLLTLLTYGLIFAGLATLKGGLLLLALPLLLYLAAALLYRPTAIQLTVKRHLDAEHISPDEPLSVRVTVLNEGRLLDEALLEDVVPPGLTLIEGQSRRLTQLPAQERVELSYTLHGQRGAYTFPGLRVTVRDRFALFREQTTLPVESRLLVLPEVIKLRRVDIRPRQTRLYTGAIPAQEGGPGVSFFGVRTYQPGDPLRWINHRATARHRQSLFINEFQQERMVDIGLILDARRQSHIVAGGSLFEESVRATAALASEFLNAGNRVGLFIYGNTLDWTYPGYGKLQRQRILYALARTAPSDSQVFAKLEHLPSQLFPTRSQLVFISPLLPADAGVLTRLRARGYHLLVISPNPLTVEGQQIEDPSMGANSGVHPSDTLTMATRIASLERALLLGKLRQAGIRVLDWPTEMPLPEAMHLALGRFQPLSR